MAADHGNGEINAAPQDLGIEISSAQFPGAETITCSPDPWRRLFARHFDVLLWGVLIAIPIPLYFGDMSGKNEDFLAWIESYRLLVGPCIYIIWLPLEALLISKFGTTPIKWCFGISIRTRDGDKLTFSSALSRTVQVWIRGDGLGFLPVMLATRAIAYNRLTNTGSTSWDDSCKARVHHEPWGYGRAIACTLLVVAVYALVLFPIA